MSHDHRVLLSLPHRLRFVAGAFEDQGGAMLAEFVRMNAAPEPRAQVFVDSNVATAHPNLIETVNAWAANHGITLAGEPTIVPGGETCKNDPAILESILRTLHDAKLCRRSYAVVIGGGAVLDAVGYAASIVHRGIRLVRVPSTTLAQCDSGVGVKNGINSFGKKNYLGTFAVPWAVVNDESLLGTLADADWIGGFSEVVKVALLKEPALFDRVEANADAIASRDESISTPMLRRSAELHLAHICAGGDPFELTEARPLDFGHWAAHKLEQMTGFELTHGHAVAIGLALDVSYAHAVGLLDEASTDRILSTLDALGFTLSHSALAHADALMEGLDEFREHLGGRLTITLIDAIGSQVEVNEIDTTAMARCASRLATRDATQPVR